MAYNDVTDRRAVISAIEEFELVGRDEFLHKYGFARSRDYYIEWGERLYDSKAILGVAHAYQFPEQGPLQSSEFSGGKGHACRILERLGFSICKVPS